MDLKSFTSAMEQIAEEKGIPSEKVLDIIEQAIAAAYKKEYGKKGQKIKADLDLKTGQANFWQEKLVVNEDMIVSRDQPEDSSSEKVRFNPQRHITLEEAQKIDSDVEPGQTLKIDLEDHQDFGRISAQTAKQVILQKVKETQRELAFEEYQKKEGDIVSGVVQRIEKGRVYFNIGKTLGVLPPEEKIPGETYRPSQRFKLYILDVEKTPKGPKVILSRAYPKLVSKLFELEVPEISSGQVEIKSIAREPGSRTKVAVTGLEEGIDPIGSVVGQRGTRVMVVINELGGEEIDVVEWSKEPEEFIANALSPAKVIEVQIKPKNKALCVVPEDQLSLAIGKKGQNVRLAAKLTGWKIDVKSAEALEEQKEKPKEEEKEKEEPEK